MNYIVFDLEWNQSKLGKGGEKENFPFEIIEIGAVKLDKNRNFLEEYHQIIRPVVYPELNTKTQEIIHMCPSELEEGVAFPEAARAFLDWCGVDYRFCTWGTMDLTELQRNMDYYHMEYSLPWPLFYYDVQKLFALDTEGRKNPRALEYAVEYFGFVKKEGFHRALWDAEYTAKIFAALKEKIVMEYYSVDYYQIPRNKSEEIYLNFDGYSKYVSREFATKEDAFTKAEIKELCCCICKKRIIKKMDWFSNNMKNFYSLGCCQEHGYMKGRIQVNRSKSGRVFLVKIVSAVDFEGAKGVRRRYEEVKIRKKEKRKGAVEK